MISRDQVPALRGSGVRGSDDQRIGSVGEVYLHGETGEPVWASVRTGMFGLNETYVPLAGATFADRVVHLPYDHEAVKAAPQVTAHDDLLSTDDQLALQLHYGSISTGVAPAAGYADDLAVDEMAGDDSAVDDVTAYENDGDLAETAAVAPATVIVEEEVVEWYDRPAGEADALGGPDDGTAAVPGTGAESWPDELDDDRTDDEPVAVTVQETVTVLTPEETQQPDSAATPTDQTDGVGAPTDQSVRAEESTALPADDEIGATQVTPAATDDLASPGTTSYEGPESERRV